MRARLPSDEASGVRRSRSCAASFEPASEAPKTLVATASQLLSNVTHLAGVVTLPLATGAPR